MHEALSFTDRRRILPSWPGGLLILMYHLIEAPPLRHPWRGLYVTPGRLRAQLRDLQRQGDRFVTLDEWNEKRAPGRQVAVTFDDAFQNILRNALPVLTELGIRAITYVVAGAVGTTNAWDRDGGGQSRPLMQAAEIRAWIQGGQEIGSHGLNHVHLTKLSRPEVRREIVESKKILEDLSGRPVRHFCFPYGSWSPELGDIVREAGYATACTTESGVNLAGQDAYRLRRCLARHGRPFATALAEALNPWQRFRSRLLPPDV